MVIISTINLRFIFKDQFRTFSTITLYFVTWNWVLTFPLKIVHFLRWLWLWLWLIFWSFFLLYRLLILSIQIRIIFLDYHSLNSTGFITRVVLFVVFPNSCSNFKLVHHTIFDVKCFVLVWHRLIIGVLIYVSGVICDEVVVVIINIVVLRVWIVNLFNEWIDTLAYLLLTFVKTLESQLILCALADCQRDIAAQRFNCTHIGRINNNPPRFTEFQLVAT